MRKPVPQSHVVVRSVPSGVWFGVIQGWEGTTVHLTEARKVWSWEGAGACSGLADYGPSGGKIAPPVAAWVSEVCEVITVTDRALERFSAIPDWAP